MKLWLSSAVALSILEQGDQLRPLETGGVLLGWIDKGDRVVTGLIGPGPGARHYRSKFAPDHHWQMRELDSAFAESDGDLNYIGDWHTHPCGPASMSWVDRRTLGRIAHKVSHAVMLIGDPTSDHRPFAAWTAKRSGWFRSGYAEVPIKIFDPSSAWPSTIVLR